MKFVCDKSQFVHTINTVQRAVAAKSNNKALEGILITAKNDTITMCGFNGDIGIKASIHCPIIEEGELVADAKLFGDIIRKLPGSSLDFTSDEKYQMTIIGGDASFRISGMDPEEYPDLPNVEAKYTMTAQQSTLKSMIRQTVFAVSDSEIKPIHTGTLFELNSDCLRLVAVDGYRLAVREEPVQCPIETTFVVPGKTLHELLRIFEDEGDSMVTIQASLRHILFIMDDVVVVSRLIEGEFLDYKSALPKSSATEVNVKVSDFANSLDRVSLIITDKLKSPVRCEFLDGTIRIYCGTPIGIVNDKINCELKGKEIEIGYNNRYMMEALKNTECDEVRIMLNTPLSPILILPKEGESFKFLVLPVRLKAN